MNGWTRTVDEHNFGLTAPANGRCRVHVLVSATHTPLVVGTQVADGNEGQSLGNGAEGFTLQAWRTYLPALPAPPILLINYVDDAQDPAWNEYSGHVAELEYDRGRGTYVAGFRGMTDLERAAVVEAAEFGRGDRYVATPVEPWPYRQIWRDTPVRLLPPTSPFRADRCMGRGRLSRWGRFLRLVRGGSPRAGSSCCWYHGGDWTTAVQAVQRALRTVEASPPDDPEDVLWRALKVLDADALSPWTREAANSLLTAPIDLSADGYVNGQHRAQAMKDQGVDVTVVIEMALRKTWQLTCGAYRL